MTPQLSAILSEINFSLVEERDPERASSFCLRLTQTGGQIYANAKQARDAANILNRLVRDAENLRRKLACLSENERQAIEYLGGVIWPPEIRNTHPTTERAVVALEKLDSGLRSLLLVADNEDALQPQGRPKSAVLQIGTALAEVYLIGLGEMVTCGTAGVKNEPSTRFVRMLFEICNCLEVPNRSLRSVRRAAEDARDLFTDQDRKELTAIHEGRSPAVPRTTPMFRWQK